MTVTDLQSQVLDKNQYIRKIWLSPDPSEQELLAYYTFCLEKKNPDQRTILIVGRGALTQQLISQCGHLNILTCELVQEALGYLLKYEIATVLTTYTDPESVHNLLKILYINKQIDRIHFIYKIHQKKTYHVLDQHDKYPQTARFIEGNFPYAVFSQIFENSLRIFEHKTQIKDALDFTCQLDRVAHIPGDILELGSYRGHSGYVLAQFQQQICEQFRDGYEKQIFLCDTFEEFPTEDLAIDSIWNGTHSVYYSKVQEIFKDIKNVELIKGDIFQTLKPLSQNRTFSYVFLDVDSYRATKYSLETIYNKLSPGGVIVCQDYGKEHCIGARMAIDNFIHNNRPLYSFSFFSGLKFIFRSF